MAKKLDPYRETARIALEPWLVEAALAHRFIRLSIGSIAGSAVRHHRVSAARRLAQAKGFPQKKYFWGRLPRPFPFVLWKQRRARRPRKQAEIPKCKNLTRETEKTGRLA
jgi:hypothetical protein